MKEVLRSIGISEDEEKIYTHLLKEGHSKVTSLASELNMARTSLYRFLDLLQRKGLVSQIIEENVKTYSATEPKRLLDIVKETEVEIKEFVKNLENSKKESKEDVSVKVFKGNEGIKSVMADIIREGKDYIMIGQGENFMEEELFTFSHQWVMKIEKKKINGKLLGTKEMFKNVPISSTEKKKYLAKELVPKIHMVIYGNKTIQIIWSKIPYSILIENKEIAESNKIYFDYLWKMAKK